MLRWGPSASQAISDALERARSAGPAVLVITGEAGTGKTCLVDELVDQAGDFTVLFAENPETDEHPPGGVLAQWGVPLTDGSAAAGRSARAIAQQLNSRLDELSVDGPVLLCLDDLQWADTESVQALTVLLRRSAGDRLLVCVAGRPLAPQIHPDWQRWTDGRDRILRVELTGLDLHDTVTLARERHPELGENSIRKLWEHTGGNPLYLTALLNEHDAHDLMQMRSLPAPAAYADLVSERLSRLPDHGVRAMRATAVLGSGWQRLFDVAELAGLEEAHTATQGLVKDGLLQTRDLGVGVSVRISHALTRAAVYDQIPLSERRALHAKAADIVDHVEDRYDHRFSAVERYDDELAAELEAFAAEHHEVRMHRAAARYLRAAAALSSSRDERQRRWLESVYERILAQDLEVAKLVYYEIEQVDDHARRDLLLGALATFEQDNFEAIYWFKKQLGDDESTAPVDPAIHYRIEILLAWARVQGGGTTEEIARGLARAQPLEPKDVALQGWALFAAGLVQLRTRHVDEILAPLAELSDNPAAVPWDQRFQLAWRGTVRALTGMADEAVADLGNVVTRVDEGALEAGMPHYHALLAASQWFTGDWNRAKLNFGLSVDLSGHYLAPTAAVLLPLSAIGRGDLAEADELIAEADALMRRDPWVEATDWLDIVRVLRLHAGADEGSRRRRAFDALREKVAEVEAGRSHRSPLWLGHAAIAAIWAKEPDAASRCVELMVAAAPERLAWRSTVRHWLRGLIAESRGIAAEAIDELRKAVSDAELSLPLYRAHILADHARVAHVLGDPKAAERSLAEAGALYRRLGASGYADRVDSARQVGSAPARTARVSLTDREQDVLTLIAAGMSYAQIARDLFVTQSTVGYHLSNIYRKVGVNSRHELTAMVRADPGAYGIVTA